MQTLRFTAKKIFLINMLCLLTVSIVLNTESVHAQMSDNTKSTTGKITIPVVEDARIFSRFDDKIPAIVNYFTPTTEEAVIKFYQEAYGEPTEQERKRGRLTVSFLKNQQQIRVIISQQNNLRQVDVIVNNHSES
jgi:hypothetical protein